MDTPTLPRLLTSEDVGAWLSLSPSRVERLARKGLIPCRQLPTGDIVFDEAELTEWARGLPPGKKVRCAD
jgi:hypothetical protein